MLEPKINTDNIACVLSLLLAVYIQTELGIVPICSSDHPHTVDFGAQDILSCFSIAVQRKGPCSKPVREGDRQAIIR